MKSAIEKRTINGVLINILSFLVTFGQNILLVPIFLKYWGNDRYGLWIGLTAVYGILQTLDTGHQAFVGNEISRDYHLDFKKLKVVLASSIWMAIIIGLLEVLTVVFIICSGFLSQILKINQEHVFNDASIGLLILVSTWIFYGSIGGIIVKLYLPSGLYVKGMWLGILVRLSQSLTILMVLYSGGSILHTCIGVSIVQTIISCFIIWDVCNSFPSLYPFWKDGSWKIGWLNLSKSLVITGVGLMTQLQTNGIILLVSSIFGAATAPVFTTVRTLANTFIQATAIITNT
jgi:hypothetical protein